MVYLEPSEYVTYGLSTETSDAWIAAASCMMEAYCRRSSLLNSSYTERLRVNRGQGTVQLTYGPVAEVNSVRAKYGAVRTDMADAGLLSCALIFGLPAQWVDLDASSISVDATSGELQLPLNVLGLPFTEVEVNYSAGLAAIPDAVKFACAQIVKNAQATPGLNVRSSKLDSLQTEYFSDSLLDRQVQALLRPFVAERLG